MGRKQKIISVEFGIATIRIVEMEQGIRPKIYHFLELKTPELAISDGNIADDKLSELKEIIVSALKQNKIKTRKAVFTLFSSKIITREVSFPELKEKQLKQVIEENINDYFPIELDDYRVTHTKIDSVIEADNSVRNKVLVIAAEKKLVSQYEKLADMCRLTLIDVDYVGNSVYRALMKTPRFEPEMYVKVEAENTLIMILEDDRLVLQRSLNTGIGADIGTHSREEQRDAIRPIIGTISRVLHYYLGQSSNHINKVTIMGSGALYIDLFKELGDNDLITYDILEASAENLILKRDCKKDQISDFIACIGAGISPVKLINYKSSIKKVNYLRASILMIVLYVFINISLLLLAQIPYLDAKEHERELIKLEGIYQEGESIYNENVATKAFYDRFMAGDELTKHANDGLVDFISELEKKLPEDVTVLSLFSDDEMITMQMEVSSKEEAAGTIDTLRNFESVMDVEVGSITEEVEEVKEILERLELEEKNEDEEADEKEPAQTQTNVKVSFTITCTYYPRHQDSVEMEE